MNREQLHEKARSCMNDLICEMESEMEESMELSLAKQARIILLLSAEAGRLARVKK